MDFEKESVKFTELQNEVTELVESRQKLETQYQENLIVKKEFDLLKDKTEGEQKVFKMTGPVLVPIEYEEATMNVDKRLEFITGEIERVEKKIEVKQKEMTDSRNKLISMRSQMQQQ